MIGFVKCVCLLFFLDEAQAADLSSTSEEQLDPHPEATKEVGPNHAVDRTEESVLDKDPVAPPDHPDNLSESETRLADIALQKVQESEE